MEIAIIEPNTLISLGLKELLKSVAPNATVRSFSDFGSFIDDTPDMYSFYLISSQTFILYTAFFHSRTHKIIILVDGTQNNASHSPARILNTRQSEERMISNLKLFLEGKRSTPHEMHDDNGLTSREIEVLVLVTKGLINKEIAEKLNISLTTVITHRKNITEKLGIKSVSGLTIYAIMNGYVSPDRI